MSAGSSWWQLLRHPPAVHTCERMSTLLFWGGKFPWCSKHVSSSQQQQEWTVSAYGVGVVLKDDAGRIGDSGGHKLQ